MHNEALEMVMPIRDERVASRNNGAVSCIGRAAIGLVLTSFALGFGFPGASAQVPGAVAYSGRLTDGTGWGKSQSVALTVRLYDQAAGGLALWEKEFPAVAVVDGFFSVSLNVGTDPVTLEPVPVNKIAQEHDSLWLATCLGQGCAPTAELEPRNLVSSVPYALRAGHADDGIPPGSIVAYGGSTPPPGGGWLLCNGASVDRSKYPALFAAVGTAYGAADEEHFNVPDFRGRFLRGVDGGTGRDPDSAGRTPSNPGGNAGAGVGSLQDAAFQSHTHNDNFSLAADGSHTHLLVDPGKCDTAGKAIVPGFSPASADGGWGAPGIVEAAGNHTHTVKGAVGAAVGGGAETRPSNLYVSYIIKY
jgi:microcystin-dependent protein